MSYKKMDSTIKEKWVKALRSGRYRQAKHILKTSKNRWPTDYCCLGVLATILRSEWTDFNTVRSTNINGKKVQGHNGSAVSLSDEFCDAVGLNRRSHDKLTILNDETGYNFKQIADWIEKNL